jgi:hypothetical protein
MAKALVFGECTDGNIGSLRERRDILDHQENEEKIHSCITQHETNGTMHAMHRKSMHEISNGEKPLVTYRPRDKYSIESI